MLFLIRDEFLIILCADHAFFGKLDLAAFSFFPSSFTFSVECLSLQSLTPTLPSGFFSLDPTKDLGRIRSWTKPYQRRAAVLEWVFF